jgi:hypothetical protein
MTPQEAIFAAIRNNDLATLADAINTDPGVLEARDERGSTPLVLASYLGNREATKALVEAGADLNAFSATGTALMGVCFKGYDDIAAYLIDAGADVNASDPKAANGGTALIFAAMFNREDIVNLLLEKGADAGAKDGNGLTAADNARNQGLKDLAARL